MLAGCGGEREPAARLPAALAERLAERSDSVAALLDAGEACGARSEAQQLQTDAIAAVNDGDVPDELQEELLGSVNALLAAIRCDPAVALDSAVTDARRLAALLRESSG